MMPYFNPRAPYGARRLKPGEFARTGNISIHAPHTGRDESLGRNPKAHTAISIHAPHTGRDTECQVVAPAVIPISIHAPHTGRDGAPSRSSARAAYFNPRAPYGARRDNERFTDATLISIHAPHTGRDLVVELAQLSRPEFQSTRPIRGATRLAAAGYAQPERFQSTRPIRGATTHPEIHRPECNDFNPRAPYGARRGPGFAGGDPSDFNPRAPYGARHPGSGGPGPAPDFNPRAPYGARHDALCRNVEVVAISIHAPHTGRDLFLP